MPRDDDAALVSAARAGSASAFPQLMDRHQEAVRAFLRTLVADPHEAEDLAQETFLTAWTRLASWRGEASVRTWLCGIAWRKASSAWRVLKRRRQRDIGYSEQAALERSADTSAEERVIILNALAQLPLEMRAAVALCLSGELSHTETAGILGLPVGTVKSHVARGRARLLTALGDER